MTKEEFFNRSILSHTWSWMERYAKKGYFFEISNETLRNNVKDMMETLEAVYPDRWSFLFEDCCRFPRILIHFPCFQISNSEGYSHTIKDLFVKLYTTIDQSTGKISFENSISGFRTTLTDAELHTGYLHSHLKSADRNYFESFNTKDVPNRWFCLGSGETLDLLDVMAGADEFDKNLFELFLYTLDGFVKWESLEGGPYIKLRSIHLNSENDVSKYQIRTHIVESAKDILRYDTDLQRKLKYTFSNGNVSVIPDMDFEEVLKIFFLGKNLMSMFCIYESRDYWKVPEKYLNTQEYTENEGILFRGYKKSLKLIDTVYQKNRELLDTSNLIIHPRIVQTLIDYLNERVTFKYLNYYARKRKIDEAREAVHQYRGVSGDNQEDTIPVQQYNPF